MHVWILQVYLSHRISWNERESGAMGSNLSLGFLCLWYLFTGMTISGFLQVLWFPSPFVCSCVCCMLCVCVCIWGPPKKVLVHTCMLYEKCFKPTLMGKCAIQMHCVIIIKTNHLCIPCSNSLAILYKFTVHVCLYKSCLFWYICMCVCGLYNRCTESYFYVWVQNI